MKKNYETFARPAMAAAILVLSAPVYAQTGPVTGAVFTTDPGCMAVNANIYNAKQDVYLDGGPARPGSAGLLSLTSYYVQVTDPSGAMVLGSSVNNTGVSKTPLVTDSVGDVVGCKQLQAIVSLPTGVPGFADTPNMGGEYKVWISTDPTFKNRFTKTDNFKVNGAQLPPGDGKITILKFYDANANGVHDDGEPAIVGWKVDLLGYPSALTAAEYKNLAVAGGMTYTAREYQPVGTNWYSTTPSPISTTPSYLNQSTVALSPGYLAETVEFGNVCTGAGNGYTLGFWSNKNGQAAISAVQRNHDLLGDLRALTLVNANGSNFDPYQYDQLRTWLLNGTATNMSFMLSVQYATMYLNMHANPVKNVIPSAMIYAAGVPGANLAGFASVQTVMDAAENALQASPLTLAGNVNRPVQEAIKNALDMANNNRTFVQPNACAFQFPVTTATITP